MKVDFRSLCHYLSSQLPQRDSLPWIRLGMRNFDDGDYFFRYQLQLVYSCRPQRCSYPRCQLINHVTLEQNPLRRRVVHAFKHVTRRQLNAVAAIKPRFALNSIAYGCRGYTILGCSVFDVSEKHCMEISIIQTLPRSERVNPVQVCVHPTDGKRQYRGIKSALK